MSREVVADDLLVLQDLVGLDHLPGLPHQLLVLQAVHCARLKLEEDLRKI